MTPITPSWLESTVFYELYPQSFLDTNSDGIGDIEGIIRKLDYIKSLGANAIWLNPCFASPFRDAGYDVEDFYAVAPRYGNNADLVRLFEAAHQRGMKVCLDLVAGHTSDQHPWFRSSCSAKRNKYSNWYVWTNSVWEEGDNMIRGYGDRDGNFLTNFFYHQPSLNYGYANPDPTKPWQLPVSHPDVQAVRAELFKIMRYWLDLGADGFRVDMAHSLVKADPDLKETMAFWADVRAMFDLDYPEAVLMSEWSDPAKAILAGFHVDFMLAFGKPPAYTSLLRKEKGRDLNPSAQDGHSYFDKEGKGNIREFLDTYLEHYLIIKDKGYITIPTGNHDCPRLAMGRTQEELMTVFAMIMTMPGIPFIYNGDEIGMRQVECLISKEGGYSRTGARTPMQWDRTLNAGFSDAASSNLYLPVDPDPGRPNVYDQESDPMSLLNVVRRLARLRKEHSALCADGNFIPLYAEPGKYPFIYQRSNASGDFVIAINPSAQPVQASFCGSHRIGSLHKIEGNKVRCQVVNADFQLEMPGISYAIFKCGAPFGSGLRNNN
ncbi:MAG: glycosylase [Verrucomicrobia bacterium 61-8]|nr:glycosylase [Verrucomicrobiota bacterium]OJV23486.1 MAG: glycosylase [Verrucomicrobia bacterium 61-8]